MFFEVDVHYPEKLHDLHNSLLFSPEKIKIGKVEKPAADLMKKLIFFFFFFASEIYRKKVQKGIKFKRHSYNIYIDMNTEKNIKKSSKT